MDKPYYCTGCCETRDKAVHPLVLVEGKHICSICAGDKPKGWIADRANKVKLSWLIIGLLIGIGIGVLIGNS